MYRGYRRRFRYARRRYRPPVTAPVRVYRRRYKRRPKRKARISRRTLLNITSRKKQDNMLAWHKDDPYVGGSVGAWNMNKAGAFDGRYWVFGFIPTARTITSSSSAGESNINDDASRTATRCYWRGVKEHIRLESTTGRNLLWRRICFKFTGTEILRDNSAGLGALWEETSNGYVRASTLLIPSSLSPVWNNLAVILFKGVANSDWNDLMSAKVDNTRVTLAYDKTVNLKPPNEAGQQWSFKRWHPMNSTLVYNDDEAGGAKLGTELSANTRYSMGDYYIIDIFDFGLAPDDDTEVNYSVNATAYWHER